MRLSPRILLIPIVAALAALAPAASPALASGPPVEPTCVQQVCLVVTVESSNEIYIAARAKVPSGACGHFQATVAVANDVLRASSDVQCGVGPTWYSGIFVPASSGTVKVRFISTPETFGEPLVHF